MIVEEIIDGGVRVLHYSNLGMMMRQQPTGVIYPEAIDLMPCAYTYEETDIPIEDDGEATAQEILDILLGDENDDN